jgi:hypothetical protein
MAFPFEQWPSGPWISCLQDGDSYLLRPNVEGNRRAAPTIARKKAGTGASG